MERTQWKNGPHLLEFEPPDLFHCYVLETVELEHAQETFRVFNEEVIPKVGGAYYLMHLKEGLGAATTPETRKFVGRQPPSWKAMAIVGGSAITRAAFNVALRAMNLLSKAQVPTKMFKDVDEAKAWIAALRAAEQSQPAANG